MSRQRVIVMISATLAIFAGVALAQIGAEDWSGVSGGKHIAGGITVDSGDLTVTAGDLVLTAGSVAAVGQLADVVYTIAAAGGGAQTVAVQFNDGAGTAMATATAVTFYLADDAAGLTPTASAPTALAAGSDGALIESVANAAGVAITEADGDLDVTVTSASSGTAWYLVIVLPDGRRDVSGALIPTPA